MKAPMPQLPWTEDRSEALQCGATHARTRRRRSPRRRLRAYEAGWFRIDYDAYDVVVGGKRVHLRLREFELLHALVRFPNRVFSRGEILRMAWRDDERVDARTIDVHIRRLRMRLERDEAHPELIVTVRGVGYKFSDRALQAARTGTALGPRRKDGDGATSGHRMADSDTLTG